MSSLALQKKPPAPRARSLLQRVSINQKFFRSPEDAHAVEAAQRAFRFAELAEPKGHYAQQVRELYAEAQKARVWKYDPPDMVINGLNRIPNYHVLAAVDGETVAGTVRAVLLENARVVFGSCLVVADAYQKRGLSIPLILAAMSVANKDSTARDGQGILGAVLGVDDNPAMRAFHAKWGVRFIHQKTLPFIMPEINGDAAPARTFGVRRERTNAASYLDGSALKTILSDLNGVQLALGYPADAVQRLHSKQLKRLHRLSSGKVRLHTAEEYAHLHTPGEF